MPGSHALDTLVKTRLRTWPQRPPGLGRRVGGHENWFRGRPGEASIVCHPFLKPPGAAQLRTIPDGLWLNFGGTAVEPFADIFVIEACGSIANLLDKRSRFAPSTQSMLAVCPTPWLEAPCPSDVGKPRWKAIPQLGREPRSQFVIPVRDQRVMFALKPAHYRQMVQDLTPHPHEYFVPMDALTAEGSEHSPALHALMARACPTANFLAAGLEWWEAEARPSVAVAARGRPLVAAHDVMVDPFGDEAAGLVDGRFRVVDAVQRRAGLERAHVVRAQRAQVRVGRDHRPLAAPGDLAVVGP